MASNLHLRSWQPVLNRSQGFFLRLASVTSGREAPEVANDPLNLLFY